jgi:hypothetical protein
MKVKSCKDVISFCKDVTLFKDAVIISVLFFIKCDFPFVKMLFYSEMELLFRFCFLLNATYVLPKITF